MRHCFRKKIRRAKPPIIPILGPSPLQELLPIYLEFQEFTDHVSRRFGIPRELLEPENSSYAAAKMQAEQFDRRVKG